MPLAFIWHSFGWDVYGARDIAAAHPQCTNTARPEHRCTKSDPPQRDVQTFSFQGFLGRDEPRRPIGTTPIACPRLCRGEASAHGRRQNETHLGRRVAKAPQVLWRNTGAVTKGNARQGIQVLKPLRERTRHRGRHMQLERVGAERDNLHGCVCAHEVCRRGCRWV